MTDNEWNRCDTCGQHPGECLTEQSAEINRLRFVVANKSEWLKDALETNKNLVEDRFHNDASFEAQDQEIARLQQALAEQVQSKVRLMCRIDELEKRLAKRKRKGF